MKLSNIAALAATASLASAHKCQNITVEVTASARNGKFNQSTPQTDVDVTNFILELARLGTNYTKSVLEGYQTVSGSYKLATTYCEPDHGPGNVVQLLTHGIGFDRSYWDVPFNNYNYSYSNEAVDQYGYSTFSWDRLGIGMSQHGEPINEIQAMLEVDALRALTEKLRNGTIPGVSKKYNKVVHVGHSFGSQHTYLLTAMHPNISDGIALTGFSQDAPGVADFLFGGNFVQANTMAALAAYPDGYLAGGDASAAQTNFFAPGDFDPKLLAYAAMTGEPVTVGELLTFGGEDNTTNTFAGPTIIVTGEHDLPYCAGNCYAGPPGYSSYPAFALTTIPNAKNPEAFIVPGAGHGLNLQYSHPLTYATINNYFLHNGLAPSSGSGNGGNGYNHGH